MTMKLQQSQKKDVLRGNISFAVVLFTDI